MKKMTNILRKTGEKMANMSIDPRCWPWNAHQPKPPAKIQEKMLENR